jgi:uncharacterized protein (TIGR02271 family)
MSRPTGDHDDRTSDAPLRGGDDKTRAMTLSEERLRVGTETERAGAVRAVKHVDVENVSERVQRGTEHADLDRVAVPDAEGDSGEVETLPDGSLSIPVFEEQLVVTKRLVVRERVIVRKHTVYEEHEVSADLKRERLEVEADGDVVVQDDARMRS